MGKAARALFSYVVAALIASLSSNCVVASTDSPIPEIAPECRQAAEGKEDICAAAVKVIAEEGDFNDLLKNLNKKHSAFYKARKAGLDLLNDAEAEVVTAMESFTDRTYVVGQQDIDLEPVESALDRAQELFGRALKNRSKVRPSRRAWEVATLVAESGAKDYAKSLQTFEKLNADALTSLKRREQHLKRAIMKQKSSVLKQLKRAENASVIAKTLATVSNSSQAEIDKAFLQSRRTVSAAAATKRYLTVLESDIKLVAAEIKEVQNQGLSTDEDPIGDHPQLSQLRDSAQKAAASAMLSE